MKTQTLFFYPSYFVLKRVDNFLYEPRDFLIIENVKMKVVNVVDEIDCDGWLVRKIYLEHI